LDAGDVHLEPGTTKNGEGRLFVTAELRALLERQWRVHVALRAAGRIVPWVFHRDGEPIKDYRKAWALAIVGAGCPGRTPHDFRRTAVRNLVRAGVAEQVAMKMIGHKTRLIFDRYHIVSHADYHLSQAPHCQGALSVCSAKTRAVSSAAAAPPVRLARPGAD
jgi:integrase